MGWGCYKHEMDAGSENWQEAVKALCDEMLERRPRTFGRQIEVCPLCWRELESKHDALQVRVKELEHKASEHLTKPDGEISETDWLRAELDRVSSEVGLLMRSVEERDEQIAQRESEAGEHNGVETELSKRVHMIEGGHEPCTVKSTGQMIGGFLIVRCTDCGAIYGNM